MLAKQSKSSRRGGVTGLAVSESGERRGSEGNFTLVQFRPSKIYIHICICRHSGIMYEDIFGPQHRPCRRPYQLCACTCAWPYVYIFKGGCTYRMASSGPLTLLHNIIINIVEDIYIHIIYEPRGGESPGKMKSRKIYLFKTNFQFRALAKSADMWNAGWVGYENNCGIII